MKGRMGFFGVVDISKNFNIPSFYQGQPFRLEVKEKILLLKFGSGKRKNAGFALSQLISECLNDSMAVVYYDESAMYFAPYKKGSEFLESEIKKLRPKGVTQ